MNNVVVLFRRREGLIPPPELDIIDGGNASTDYSLLDTIDGGNASTDYTLLDTYDGGNASSQFLTNP